jgi:hypothetical protein
MIWPFLTPYDLVFAGSLYWSNLQPTGKEFRPIEDDGTVFLGAAVNPINPPIELPGTNNSPAPRLIAGWWEVQIQATTKKGAQLESISFLMWPQR